MHTDTAVLLAEYLAQPNGAIAANGQSEAIAQCHGGLGHGDGAAERLIQTNLSVAVVTTENRFGPLDKACAVKNAQLDIAFRGNRAHGAAIGFAGTVVNDELGQQRFHAVGYIAVVIDGLIQNLHELCGAGLKRRNLRDRDTPRCLCAFEVTAGDDAQCIYPADVPVIQQHTENFPQCQGGKFAVEIFGECVNVFSVFLQLGHCGVDGNIGVEVEVLQAELALIDFSGKVRSFQTFRHVAAVLSGNSHHTNTVGIKNLQTIGRPLVGGFTTEVDGERMWCHQIISR